MFALLFLSKNACLLYSMYVCAILGSDAHSKHEDLNFAHGVFFGTVMQNILCSPQPMTVPRPDTGTLSISARASHRIWIFMQPRENKPDHVACQAAHLCEMLKCVQSLQSPSSGTATGGLPDSARRNLAVFST